MEIKLKSKDLQVQKGVNDKIELVNSIAQVQGKISNVISGDFVLSKLSDQEKEYIIEMSNNAFLSKRILDNVKEKGFKWEWNKKTKKWNKEELNKDELEQLTKNEQKCFDSYMNRIYMINIVNRNVPRNYIVEKITGIRDEEEEPETRAKNMANKIKEALGNKEEE